MSALRLRRQAINGFREYRCLSTILSTENELFTATPQYPPILDLSPEKVKERKNEQEYEELKKVKTVEEKQIKLNMPRFYGFKCYMLQDDYIPYNNLPLIQHVTRTHLIKSQNLPNYYSAIDVSNIDNSIKSVIEELILFEWERWRQTRDLKKHQVDEVEAENTLCSILCKQINRAVLNSVTRVFPHLQGVQVDLNSRVESFWYAGGMNPPERIKQSRRGLEWLKHKENEPIDRAMNYIGGANLALRADQPLRPIIPYHESENPAFEVPYFKFDPRVVGTTTEFRHIANVPGFWPGDPRQFGLLSYHQRGHILSRHYGDQEENLLALDRQGVLASFGWLNAQANFLGFNTFNDITYPLVTQTIITNGRIWSFYIYQLNTMVNHSKHVHENPKRNLCWATPALKLFEKLDNGKLEGFNEEVLHMLLKLYANSPATPSGVNLKPYLTAQEQVSADYEDDDKRQWLEREYKWLVANRPRYKLPYEIYTWEKIYKIDHKTRFMDKKTRPFELGINPFKRTLDERKPNYIPRALRPHLPRHVGRNAKEYFP